MNTEEIAPEYGVSPGTIGLIKYGAIWHHDSHPNSPAAPETLARGARRSSLGARFSLMDR